MLQIEPHGGPSPLESTRERAREATLAVKTLGGGRGLDVLLMEPEPNLTGRLRRALDRAGCRLRTAGTWAQVLDDLDGDGPVDLLLADVDDDVEAGLRAVERALGARPGLPVLLLMGHGARSDDDPGHPVVRKPFDTTGFLETVARTLDHRARPDAARPR